MFTFGGFSMYIGQHKCYGTPKSCLQESSPRRTYLTSICICRHVCGEVECLDEVVVGRSKMPSGNIGF